MFSQKRCASGAPKYRAKSALIILAGGATLLLFGCPETETNYAPYVCANGTATEGTTATPNETRCAACNQGYRLDGSACAVNTYTCINGVAAPGQPEDDGETRCERCNSGYRLVNGLCAPTAYACAFGTPAAGQPQTHHETRCASCEAGFHVENNACAQNAHTCPNGDPFRTAAPTEGAIRCLQCDAGYHLNAREACEENAHACENGTAARIDPNDRPEAHNQQLCVSCVAGYDVYSDSVTGSQTCGSDKYICFNGDAVDETAPIREAQLCANCDAGYRLEEGRCVPHQYACPNGVAARGIPAVDNETRCVSCDNARYLLEGVECAPVSPEDPLGLAAVGDTLYMVGGRGKRLYTVDPATAVATAVNSALGSGFGVGETAPAGMTVLGDTLYMVGSHRDRLYTVDTATGRAAPVGGAREFGVGEREPWSVAAVGGKLYMASLGVHTGRFYALNAATGVANFIGETRMGNWRGLVRPRGLTAIGDTLYLVMEGLYHLFIVNSATGELRHVPRAWQQDIYPLTGTPGTQNGPAFGVAEFHPSGLTAIGNTLYMGGATGLYSPLYTSPRRPRIGPSRLYTLNPDTGRATVIGAGIIDVAP